MSSGKENAAAGQMISLDKLSLPQLEQIKTQLSQEINVLQESMSRLKMVQQSFVSSDTALEQLKQVQEKKPILVPLTGSLYVPGRLVKSDRVLVDIGTGYYAHKSVDDAKKYFDKKIAFLAKQMEQLQPILQQKVIAREEITEFYQQRVMMQLQADPKLAAAVAAKSK